MNKNYEAICRGEEIAHLEESAQHYIKTGEKLRAKGYCYA